MDCLGATAQCSWRHSPLFSIIVQPSFHCACTLWYGGCTFWGPGLCQQNALSLKGEARQSIAPRRRHPGGSSANHAWTEVKAPVDREEIWPTASPVTMERPSRMRSNSRIRTRMWVCKSSGKRRDEPATGQVTAPPRPRFRLTRFSAKASASSSGRERGLLRYYLRKGKQSLWSGRSGCEPAKRLRPSQSRLARYISAGSSTVAIRLRNRATPPSSFCRKGRPALRGVER